MHHRYTRRHALGMLAALGAVPALASCGPNQSGGGSSGSSDSIRVYWWGGDLRATQTNEALKLYTDANADVKVSAENGAWEGYWDKLATMTAGKTTPDLLQMDEKYIDSYGSKGVLASLEDQSDLDLSAFPDEVLDTGRLADGTLVGVPCGTNLYAVGVNPDVLEKAGVDMPDDTTWTWEELASISQEVSDWAKGAGEDVTGADGSLVGVDVLAAWARQSGEQTFPREDEKALTKDTIVASLEFTLSLIDSGAAPAADAQIEDSTVGLEQGIFATNRSAFHFVPSSQIVTFQEASGSPMKLLRLPARKAGDAQMVNKSSMYWSIAKESANLAGTAKLASFLLNDPEVAKILKIERGVPGTEELQETVRPLLTEGELVSLDFVQAMQAEVVTPPQVTPAGAVGFGEEYDRITQDVRFKKTSTSDAADEVLTLLKDMAG